MTVSIQEENKFIFRVISILLYFVEPASCICFVMRNGFFAGSAETLPALLFSSFSSSRMFWSYKKEETGLKKVFSG